MAPRSPIKHSTTVLLFLINCKNMDFVSILQLPQVSKRPCEAAAESVTVSVDFRMVICNFSKKCEPKRSFEKRFMEATYLTMC